jgi:DNA-binding GntR family transcriptional regulator
MKRFQDGIPKKVLQEIFPQKPNKSPVSEQIYLHLKHMILSGKFKKGQRLLRSELVQILDVNEGTLSGVFSQLIKEKLVIIKPGEGSFIA